MCFFVTSLRRRPRRGPALQPPSESRKGAETPETHGPRTGPNPKANHPGRDRGQGQRQETGKNPRGETRTPTRRLKENHSANGRGLPEPDPPPRPRSRQPHTTTRTEQGKPDARVQRPKNSESPTRTKTPRTRKETGDRHRRAYKVGARNSEAHKSRTLHPG